MHSSICRLPQELKLLFIGAEEPSWTVLTLSLDRYGCSQPRFRWLRALADGARDLGRESFDCIIIDDASPSKRTVTARDQAELPQQISALRAAGCVDPILVLSDRVDDAWLASAACGEFELLVTCSGWRSEALPPWLQLAMQRNLIVREREEVGAAGRQRRQRESGESWRMLEQLQDLARRLQSTAVPDVAAREAAAAAWYREYHELVRAAVVAGADALAAETVRCVQQARSWGVSASDVVTGHVRAVESLMQGLGNRSSRHVIHQSDVLLLEVLARLADDVHRVNRPAVELPATRTTFER